MERNYSLPAPRETDTVRLPYQLDRLLLSSYDGDNGRDVWHTSGTLRWINKPAAAATGRMALGTASRADFQDARSQQLMHIHSINAPFIAPLKNAPILPRLRHFSTIFKDFFDQNTFIILSTLLFWGSKVAIPHLYPDIFLGLILPEWFWPLKLPRVPRVKSSFGVLFLKYFSFLFSRS